MCRGKDNPYIKRPAPPPSTSAAATPRARRSKWIAPFRRVLALRAA